jgi:hypothetical protein
MYAQSITPALRQIKGAVIVQQQHLARLLHSAREKALSVFTAALLLTTLIAAQLPAQAQSGTTLDINLDPFFTSLNQYLPIFISLFAIVGGIAGAMALAKYVIGAIVRAFSGGGL